MKTRHLDTRVCRLIALLSSAAIFSSAAGELCAQERKATRRAAVAAVSEPVRFIPTSENQKAPLTVSQRTAAMIALLPIDGQQPVLDIPPYNWSPPIRLSAKKPNHEERFAVNAQRVDVAAALFDFWTLHKSYGNRHPGYIKLIVDGGAITKPSLVNCYVKGEWARISGTGFDKEVPLSGTSGQLTMVMQPPLANSFESITVSALPDHELRVDYCEITPVK